MVLDRLEGKLLMPQTHNETSFGSTRDFEDLWDRVDLGCERVVPCTSYSLRHPFVETFSVVHHRTRFSVHVFSRLINDSSVVDRHALETHADSENRDLAGVRFDRRDRDTGIFERVTWTRRDYEVGHLRVLGLKLLEGDRFGSNDGDISSEHAEVLILSRIGDESESTNEVEGTTTSTYEVPSETAGRA